MTWVLHYDQSGRGTEKKPSLHCLAALRDMPRVTGYNVASKSHNNSGQENHSFSPWAFNLNWQPRKGFVNVYSKSLKT